ncbi:hypothetical protein FRC12_021544 [Ceratobasidium sp. 428]|nr:hypothetical protein FRC12_021544 [Ceratobasidium sp. 428]
MGSDDLGQSGTTADQPVALIFPQKIKALSVGRRHAVLLDALNNPWIVRSWGRPAQLVAPALDNERPETSVVQVAAGWDVCAFLTQAGEVSVVFPFHGAFDEIVQGREAPEGGEQQEVLAQGGQVNVQHWDVQHNPTRLPALPTGLPTLHPPTDADAAQDIPPKLIKIAAGEHFVIGLTDGGHVLKLDLPTSNEAELQQIVSRGNLQWNYLPRFCDVTHVRNEPGFRQDQGHEDSQRALEDLTVTHISAQFRTFVVYSTTGSSVVLLGKADTTRQDAPKIVPELQNRNVISVVLGDYHYCALTANGELFSWGKYSNGALGLGRPRQRQQRGSRFQARHAGMPLLHQPMMPILHQPARSPERRDVDKPTRVSFDHEDHIRDRYVFAVAAAGWHCGALVIDLHSSTSASDEGTPEAVLGADDPTRTSEPSASTSQPIAQLPRRTEGESGETHPPQITLPIVRGRAPFRRGGGSAYTARGARFAASDPGSDAHDGANPGRAD